ncbi:FCH-domain-containing protein, partial [Testicularia cyperi]
MPSDRRSSSAGSGHSSRSRAERASGSMGQDGGEAGRRIAAEDEYIRRELSDTNAFCNAFWGQNDIGFDAIAARMKTSQRTLEDLKLLYKERADIEAEYAKRLAKLAKQALGSHETGALKTAFDVVKIELDTTSRTHNDLASMIKKDLEGSVGDFASRSWSARKNAQANIEKLHKNKQTQEQYVNKSREKYEQDCIKINGYTAQSSLVQGKDLDKVAYKLDKAQATVNQNDKDYQNFVRALKDTTVKWNAEWKAYLDQCQDQEEERIDFTKSNLWNYANAVSAVCVADDESCERIRVSLENVETPRDIQFFIQHCGTGSLMPAPPEYINYAKGQAPPARPVYHTAKFQRNTVRPTQLPVPQTQPSPQQQQQQQQQHQQQQQQYVPQQQQQQQQPPQPQSKSPSIPPSVPAAMGAPSTKPVPPEPLQSIAQTHTYANAPPSGAADGAHSPSKLPPGAVALPGMASAATQSTRVGPIAPLGGANGGHGHSNSITAPVQGSQGSNYGAGSAPVAAAATTTDDEDPIAKALASLRMRPGGRSPGPARRESLTAESPQPPPFAQPGQIVQNMPPQRAHSPSPSMSYGGQHPPPARARSPSAAFMQAPNRATSPLPVEEVVGQYGQSFPGERKSLSRQNSVASHAGAGVQSPQQRPKSPMKPEQGFAGVGARGRSPSPQPWSRPTQQQQQQQQQQAYQPPSHHAGQTPDQPRTGTLSRRQSNIPPRSTTPLGISLDATGSVTHDQMAEDFMRRAGSVPPPPQQQQPAPPSQTGVAGVPAS